MTSFRLGWALTFLLGAFGGSSAGLAAQPQPIDRFAAMLTGAAVTTKGVSSVRWLPGTRGYLEEPIDSVAGRPMVVDSRTGALRPLLSRRAEAALVAEYRRITGSPAVLPLGPFELVRNGAAITFDRDHARFVFAVDSGRLHRLPLPKVVGPLDLATSSPGQFSPGFRHYAFIRDYDNLWLFDPSTGAEERLTVGTSEDNLVGFLDAGPWFVWSPDGTKIAYLKANQRAIYSYPLVRDLEQHATVVSFRYPFVTDSNPMLELHIVDVTTKRDVLVATSTVDRPYLRNLVWWPDSRSLMYQVIDQWQSRRELLAADPNTGESRSLLVDIDPAFLDPIDNFRVLRDGNHFLWSSERSGWRHLYLYDRRGGEPRQLTTGELVTKEVLGVDEEVGRIYFLAATRLGLEQHLFRVGLDGSGMTRVTAEPGWHEVSVSPEMSVFLDRHSSLARPWSVALRSIDGTLLRQIGSSDTTALHELGIPAPTLLELTAADGTTRVHGRLFRPAGFDSTRRYPMIVSIYGGPHTKAVRDQYVSAEFQSAVAQLGFLVLEVDARGTLDREKSFQTGNYLQMGQIDIDDQAAAVRQLRMLPYLDSTRVGITGISHGGYLTLMAMLRYPDVYQVGVAGAPIVDLRNGPRQYIGRIMRTPDANPEGYLKGDPLPLASKLRGRLLLMYGTEDRNAVNVNSMQLLRKLIEAGRPVDVAVYPYGKHVLEGADAIHGLKTTVSYFLEHLKPEGWEATRASLWR